MSHAQGVFLLNKKEFELPIVYQMLEISKKQSLLQKPEK